MRRGTLFATALLGLVMLCDRAGAGEFSATVKERIGERTQTIRLHVKGASYRLELDEEDTTLVVLFDARTGRMHVVAPRHEMFEEIGPDDATTLRDDPFQGARAVAGRCQKTVAGQETVQGYACEKTEYVRAGTKLMTQWVSPELGFPVRIERPTAGRALELVDIKVGAQDASLFRVPAGYRPVPEEGPHGPTPKLGPPVTRRPELTTVAAGTAPWGRRLAPGGELRVHVRRKLVIRTELRNCGGDPAECVVQYFRKGRALGDVETYQIEGGATRALAAKASNLDAREVRVRVTHGTVWAKVDQRLPDTAPGVADETYLARPMHHVVEVDPQARWQAVITGDCQYRPRSVGELVMYSEVRGMPPDVGPVFATEVAPFEVENGQTTTFELGRARRVGVRMLQGAVKARIRQGQADRPVDAFFRPQGAKLTRAQEGQVRQALYTDNASWLEQALDNGLGVDERFQEAPLLCKAVEFGGPAVVRLLVQRGADVRGAEKDQGLLGLALRNEKHGRALVPVLLEAGADAKRADPHRVTPLWQALALRQRDAVLEIAGLLLARGAEVDGLNRSGYTPLMSAARRGDADLVKLLLDHGANPNDRGRIRRTAMELARERGHKAIVGLLGGHVAGPEETDALLAQLKHADPGQRVQATLALGHAASPRAVAAVAQALEDPAPHVPYRSPAWTVRPSRLCARSKRRKRTATSTSARRRRGSSCVSGCACARTAGMGRLFCADRRRSTRRCSSTISRARSPARTPRVGASSSVARPRSSPTRPRSAASARFDSRASPTGRVPTACPWPGSRTGWPTRSPCSPTPRRTGGCAWGSCRPSATRCASTTPSCSAAGSVASAPSTSVRARR
ncbi:MAG: ankyrin repeat domain-containing protein [Planctomycetota bacterium]|jgi:hypothetical protein